MTDPRLVLSRLRRMLLAVLALAFAGTAVDLVLLAHHEDSLQFAPFVIIGLCLIAIGWHGVSGGTLSTRYLRIAMVMAIVGAVTGMVLHYRGNMEFQLEIDPSLGGLELMMKVVRAKAPPTLAPMNLAVLGLVGLASTYREGRT